MNELIRKLTETYGPSGSEEQIHQIIRAEIEGLVDEVSVTPLGSLIGLKRGSGGGQKIMLVAHMDEIGVIVSYIDEKGFLRFQPIGGVGALTCIGGRVRFADGTVGVIGVEKREDRSKVPTLKQLYVDVGATSRDDCPVHVGDAACFHRPFEVMGPRLMSKALDDRIGCAILIETLRRLEGSPHDLYFVFSVQEETTLSGARTAAYGIDPDLAISVDVTDTGDTPKAEYMAVSLGKGPAIKVQDGGMVAHPRVKDLMVQRAREAGIPYQMEVLEGGTTDAAVTQIARAGVPSGCMSIPCRYIHFPSEVVDAGDVEHCVELLKAIVSH